MNLERNVYLNNISPYIPGRAFEDVKSEVEAEEIIRLASNENPYGPSSKVRELYQNYNFETHLYPESTYRTLRKIIAQKNDVSSSEVIVSNGAGNILELIAQAYLNEGDEVIYSVPTFSLYKKTSLLRGAVVKEIPLNEHMVYDLDETLHQITKKTKIIYLCNPNNPTGTLIEDSKMIEFLKELPENILIVIDEAYIEFIKKEGYIHGSDLMKYHANIIIVRTFSKIYGLAAARVGYAIGKVELLDSLNLIRDPFPVSSFSAKAAQTALENENYVNYIHTENKKGLNFLNNELKRMNIKFFNSEANFIFIELERSAEEYELEFLKAGIIIRSCASFGCPNHIRVTVGTEAENMRFIEVLDKIHEKLM